MPMQKIINEPKAFVDEMLEGVLLAHPESLRAPAKRVLVRASAPPEGQGRHCHRRRFRPPPAVHGLCRLRPGRRGGRGDVFASPSSDQILEATRAVDGGAGVLYLYGNYSRRRHELRPGRRAVPLPKVSRPRPCWARTMSPRLRPAPEAAGGASPALPFFTKWPGPRAEEGRLARRGSRRGGAGGGRAEVHGCRPVAVRCPRRRAADVQLARPARWRSAWVSTASQGCAGGPLEPAAEIADQLVGRIVGRPPFTAG